MTCLPTIARLLSSADPEPVLRAMVHAGRMGRGGSWERRLVVGYGVQGSGDTWAEACHQWAAGARWAAENPEPGPAQGKLNLLELT